MKLHEMCLVLCDKAEETGKSLDELAALLKSISLLRRFTLEHPTICKMMWEGNSYVGAKEVKYFLKTTYTDVQHLLVAGLIAPYLQEHGTKAQFLFTQRGWDIFRLIRGENVDEVAKPPWGDKVLTTKGMALIAKGNNLKLRGSRINFRYSCDRCSRRFGCGSYGIPGSCFEKGWFSEYSLSRQIDNPQIARVVGDLFDYIRELPELEEPYKKVCQSLYDYDYLPTQTPANLDKLLKDIEAAKAYREARRSQ